MPSGFNFSSTARSSQSQSQPVVGIDADLLISTPSSLSEGRRRKDLDLDKTKKIFYQIDDRIQIQQSDSKVTTSPGHQRCVGHSSL